MSQRGDWTDEDPDAIPSYLLGDLPVEDAIEALEGVTLRNGAMDEDEAMGVRREFYQNNEQFSGGLKGERIRCVTPEDAGVFAAENDIALVDLYPDVDAERGAASIIAIPVSEQEFVLLLAYIPMEMGETIESGVNASVFLDRLESLETHPDLIDYSPTNIVMADGSGGSDHNASCFSCGATAGLERVGGVHICDDCAPDGGESGGSRSDGRGIAETTVWGDTVDFSTTHGVCVPETLANIDQWMVHKDGEKRPYAPWGEGGLRYKWGREENYRSLDDAEMVLDDEKFSGRVFIQRIEDDVAHIDGDDVRDPETGEIHPEFLDTIRMTGPTFVEVSQSGAGIHLIYTGELPDGNKQASWQLDDHPFRGNDELPSVEFYHRNRVIVFTGERVDGTPTELNDWNEAAIAELIEENDDSADDGDEDERPEPAREEYNLSEYEPDVTSSSDTTTDIRDIFAAIDRLDARDVAERTIVNSWNGSATTSDEHRAFDPTWGPQSNGTANIVNREIWQDTGDRGGYGGPVVMALIDAGEIRPREASPRKTKGQLWWTGVDHLRDLGYDIPEYVNPSTGGDADPLSLTPTDAINAFSHDEYRRYASKRGVEWPSVEDVRDRLQKHIENAIKNRDDAVIDAPTGAGKTHVVASTPWKQKTDITDGDPVIHALKTKKARDDAAAIAEEAGVDYYVLRSRSETCPLAGGEYDPGNPHGHAPIEVEGMAVSEWIDQKCDVLDFPYSLVHSWVEEHISHQAPCEVETECPSKSIFDGVPRDDDGNPSHDVILCTQQFLHVPGLRMNTIIVMDEKPDYSDAVSSNVFRRSINRYLSWSDAPVDSYAELVTANRVGVPPKRLEEDRTPDASLEDYEDGEPSSRDFTGITDDNQVGGVLMNEYKEKFADKMEEALEEDPPRSWFKSQGDVHALAPAFARALWEAEEVADGRYMANIRYSPPRLDANANDSSGWNRIQVRVVFTQDFDIAQTWVTPDFTLADCIVGLDATSDIGMTSWWVNADETMQHEQILTDQEEQQYRRYERGLITVQVGENMNPVTKPKYINGSVGRKAQAFIENAVNEHGDGLRTAITSKNGEGMVQQAFRDAGIEEPETMHYGNEESRNDFAGEDFGYVLGATDPGDEPVMNRVAALGLDAEPERVDPLDIDGDASCDTCGGDGCHDCSGTGLKRAHGRGFTGPDAETAEAVLNEVTQHHIVQSAGRYARDADDPDDTAVVYIHTDRAPESFIDIHAPDVEWTTSDDQRERLEYVRDVSGGVSAREVADEVGCSKDAARDTLDTAAEHGLLRRRRGAGRYGATLYSPTEDFSSTGAMDWGSEFSPDCVQNVWGHYTYSAAIYSDLYPDPAGQGRGGSSAGEQVSLTYHISPHAPPD